LPLAYGGTGSVSNSIDMPDFYPDALECGTLSYPAIISLGEGAAYLTSHMYENRDKVIYLTSMFLEELGKIKGVRVYSRTNPYGIVAFSLDNMQSEIAAFKLSDEYSVMVRGGLHCAPLMHKALSSEGLVRASLSSFNSKGDIAYAIHAISRLAAL
jgi:selenocysteine lyase/cysteine desulfurase